jgi:dienelactone hydrolase
MGERGADKGETAAAPKSLRRRAMLTAGLGVAGLTSIAVLAACSPGDGSPVSDSASDTPVPSTPAAPVGLTDVVSADPEFDGQFVRALDTIPYGGADSGEAFMTARRIPTGDTEAWLREWDATATRIFDAAQDSERNGHRVSAYEGYLRAVTYYRTSGIFLYRPPLDPKFVNAYQRQKEAFARAIPLSEWSIETVSIPYENTGLDAYFATPDGPGPFPVVAMVGGYDGTKEESFFAGGVAALRRGYAVLMIDGPGQGGALIDKGLVFRPDWDAVVTPQIDWLVARPDVDATKIVLMGRSWGGYLAPRAATAEHRIAALVADAPQYTPGPNAKYLLPAEYRDQLDTGDPAALNKVLYDEMAKDPGFAFTINRGLLTHGFETPIDYLRNSQDYTLAGIAKNITCPTLLCTGENDVRGNDAQPLYDELTVPKQYIRFANADGAGEHDEAGAGALFSQRVFDWLGDTLDHRPQA